MHALQNNSFVFGDYVIGSTAAGSAPATLLFAGF